MNADHARRRAVDRAVDFILDRLHSRLDLAAIAAEAGYSPWHFQRIFTDNMGESPAVFVARARVERAVAIARATPDRPWQDIAHDVGFSTPPELSRAFRRRFELSARSWDRATPLADRDAQPGHRATRADLVAASVDVRVELVPHCRFAYMRIRDPYRAGNLASAWDEVDSWRSELTTPTSLVGMSWDDPATVPLEMCRYDLGIALADAAPLPERASERWMPSTLAAVASVDGTIEAVDTAWEHLHRIWLPSSPFHRSALPSIERFHSDPRPDWSRWMLECVVPVAGRR